MENISSTLRSHELTQRNLNAAITDLQKIPEKIKVLFLASNPDGTGQLRLDEEARDIYEKIRLSEYRDSVEFVTRWAVRTSDILQAINETNPTVIHFSGHGTDTDELVLQNTDGSIKLVSKEVIVQVISTVTDKVRLVYFNTCFSYGQAEAIVEHIDAAIGMTQAVGDEAAKVFASYFYSAIGFGKSLEVAFKQAQAALLLEGISGEDTPKLYINAALNADEVILVRP
ncbi:CHAT domain-containing protein [Ruminococcaceae bacterium OttesenSCG-928-L11]|nr:CHAT domain-containing protein [Ruminococcaceae bacterium OttesenSCG-928-L11]